ncbi:MAG: MOSC domain-containing protein [Gammaproteobacteria bacterium]|nr:MOSC domain-containing protein [Gammaproteobacteria bacterium]
MVLSELNIYPVKSLAGISLTHSVVDDFGLQHDRRWMLVDSQGKMLTQRKHARMCLIHPQLTAPGLRLSAPGMVDMELSVSHLANTCTVQVWDDVCQAYDAGDQAAQWCSEFLASDCRLTYFPDNEVRQLDQNYAQAADKTAFSDGFPFLLISQSSLDDLNSRLGAPVTMSRFRPNLVITGSKAFEEDQWQRIRIGEMTLRLVKPCSRCVIPTIDPDTGEKGKEPLTTLIKYRKRNNKVYFGQNVIADGTGELAVGMTVEILE